MLAFHRAGSKRDGAFHLMGRVTMRNRRITNRANCWSTNYENSRVATFIFLFICFGIGFAEASDGLQPKTDVKGLRPGGTIARMKEDLVAIGCELYKCKVGEGELVVVASKKLQEAQVLEVGYRFESGTQPAQMIDYVSREYNKQPVPSNRKADIVYATGHVMDVAFFGRRLVYGG
ncbi:MAG: hypothetical protein NTZ72_19155, partial [Afipia sp.]|nr:hypothetical protein [Afipia sp.]